MLLQKDLVDVVGSGAVLLGPAVSCDGFHAERDVRVQSHIHLDHMSDFTTSLTGDVLMTEPTRLLLQAQYPSLEFCQQVHTMGPDQTWENDSVSIELVSSNHMLGAVQTKVTMDDGVSLGYSGDFGWPLKRIIQVDALVMDATYGNPASKRHYTQQMAQEALCELVVAKLREGPIHLMGDSGPLDRALNLLMMEDIIAETPIVGSPRHAWSFDVHRRYGIHLPEVLLEGSAEASAVVRDQNQSFVRLWSLHSQQINDGLYPGSLIKLTKFQTLKEPIEEIFDKYFVVGLSNHADFEETMEYVSQSGAQYVVTDNVRCSSGDRGQELANIIEAELGIEARCSTNQKSRAWGR